MTKTCQLLYDLIDHKTQSNYEEINAILAQLKSETFQLFDDDIDKWIEWFLTEPFEEHEKRFIKTTGRIYKVYLKLKSNKN